MVWLQALPGYIYESDLPGVPSITSRGYEFDQATADALLAEAALQNRRNHRGQVLLSVGVNPGAPITGGGGGGGTGTGDVTTAQLNAAVALLQDRATAATDSELSAAVATLNSALTGKQDSASAATDAELASAVALLQDKATAATDAELASAVATINTSLTGKQDAGTAATDAELAAHAGDLLIHSSGIEVAYAENVTGVTTAISAAAVDVPGCVITVPANPRPVWLEANAFCDVSTAPASAATGQLGVLITDDLGNSVAFANASIEGGAGTNGQFNLIARCRIPPNTATRTYRMQANRGGSAFTYAIMNGAIAAAFRSYIAAFAH